MADRIEKNNKLDRVAENPNKEFVLDFKDQRIFMREKNSGDLHMNKTETGLYYSVEFEKMIQEQRNGLSVRGEVGLILSNLQKSGDKRIVKSDPRFGPLMHIGEMELELQVMNQLLNKWQNGTKTK